MEMDVSEAEDLYNIRRCKRNMLDNVASSNAFFKSQQLGEEDLTFEDKRKIAEDLLSKNVSLFLQRYYKFVNIEDLPYFENASNDYEVSFYIEEIKKNNNMKKRKAVIRNRRYEAMKKLCSEGVYFSDSEMRHRNPYLYEQLIGQYLTDDERSVLNKKDNRYQSFSSFLLAQIGKSYEEQHLKHQRDVAEGAIEEYDTDDSIENEEDSEKESFDIGRMVKLPDAEKRMLRAEFMTMMYENFLSGKDLNFDYSTVDENSEYDPLQQNDIDEEEKYFDENSV